MLSNHRTILKVLSIVLAGCAGSALYADALPMNHPQAAENLWREVEEPAKSSSTDLVASGNSMDTTANPNKIPEPKEEDDELLEVIEEDDTHERLVELKNSINSSLNPNKIPEPWQETEEPAKSSSTDLVASENSMDTTANPNKIPEPKEEDDELLEVIEIDDDSLRIHETLKGHFVPDAQKRLKAQIDAEMAEYDEAKEAHAEAEAAQAFLIENGLWEE